MKQFLELFKPLPGNRYLLVTTHNDAVASALVQILLPFGGTLDVHRYPGEHQTVSESNIVTHDVNSFSSVFRALPRSYDIVVFQDFYHLHHAPERMIKTAYTALANTGDIVIMQEKGTMDVAAMLEMLERMEYRAGNVIEVLDDYDLVKAKKMHMWGNGL
jgi:ERCC4-type nuclease